MTEPQPNAPLVGHVVDDEAAPSDGEKSPTPLTDLVEQPAKVMR
ncbi:MAG: DUF2587 domain-containing protein, partial [Actinomycetales bacterium]